MPSWFMSSSYPALSVTLYHHHVLMSISLSCNILLCSPRRRKIWPQLSSLWDSLESKWAKHKHDINHQSQEEPEDMMDTSSLSVEDIKIKKEQERANCYGFDVRISLETILPFFLSSFPASLIISFLRMIRTLTEIRSTKFVSLREIDNQKNELTLVWKFCTRLQPVLKLTSSEDAVAD